MKRLALALLLGVIFTATGEAGACHRFSVWKYPYPQRCKVIAYVPRRIVPIAAHNVARSAVLNLRVPDIPLPDMSATWGPPLDTPAELELIQGMQRLKALRLLGE